MSRRACAVALLAAFVTLTSAVPGLPGRTAAASCSGWSSSVNPPSSIRVFRHATGAVETVNFRAYTRNVLSREWIGSWTAASLRAGALAVKHYAWYQVLHWRGGTNGDGQCFDLRDDTVDQVYDPSKPTWTTAAAAVDATWSMRVLKNGKIFPTYYNAGSAGEACGANANGWRMYQWGTQTCGLAGRTATQIVLAYYYPGVTVSGGTDPDPSPTPSPTPQPTQRPSPTPRPSATPTLAPTAAPSSSSRPTPSATATPKPTPSHTTPTPAPTPNPDPALATPPPSQQLPGGGQSGVVGAIAPPPAPPDDPEPIVNQPASALHERAEPTRLQGPMSLPRVLVWADPGARSAAVLWPAYRLFDMRAPDGSAADPQLAAFGALWRSTVNDLVERLLQQFAWGRTGFVGVDPPWRATLAAEAQPPGGGIDSRSSTADNACAGPLMIGRARLTQPNAAIADRPTMIQVVRAGGSTSAR